MGTQPARASRQRKNSRSGAKKGRSRWGVVLRIFLALFLIGVAGAAGVFAYAYATIDVPDPDDFALAESTTLYYADGETEMGSFAEVSRRPVDLADLPDHMAHAVISSEDSSFYENMGVDVRGVVRALWNNVRGLPQQGGSTLTQQYAERYYMGEATTSYWAKFQEAIMALKIDQSQTKNEVLGNYLNTIYFGRGAYGVEMAARNYFDKPAAELELAESALLAGIIPAPSVWDPAVSPERAEQRFERVIALMVQDGWITQEEADDAEYPEVIPPRTENIYGGPTGYLLHLARQEAVERVGLTEAEIDTRGLSIVTTIDADSQEAAVQAVDNLPEDRPEQNRAALVSLESETGAIVALYGGPDFVSRSFNDATQGTAQAGSTFKPFALVAALEENIPLTQLYPSYSPMDIDGYDRPVRNYDTINRGSIDLVDMTADSINTSYVLLNRDVGPEVTQEVAIRAGLPESTSGLDPYISNVLGTASPRPIDMAQAFATFADEGVRHEPYIVAEVRDSDGSTIYEAEVSSEQVFEADVMAEATYAMEQVVERGTGQTAGEIGRPVAGKTGSSQEYRSAWFVGYVPQLTTAVVMFEEDEDGNPRQMTGFGGVDLVAGGTFPTDIWRDYMAVATDGMEIEEFPERTWTPEPGAPVPAPEPAPAPAPAPAPEPEPEPEPTEDEPTEEPTEEATEEEPTEEPEPTPTEEPTEEPTDEPTEDDSGDDPGNGPGDDPGDPPGNGDNGGGDGAGGPPGNGDGAGDGQSSP